MRLIILVQTLTPGITHYWLEFGSPAELVWFVLIKRPERDEC
jgi:hypothetical protein